MDSGAKNRVCSSVYSQFPEVRGSNPTITTLPGDKFQLIFHGNVKASDGKTIERTVRVSAAADGRILKMTTSR